MTIGMGIALFGVWMVPLSCVITDEATEEYNTYE